MTWQIAEQSGKTVVTYTSAPCNVQLSTCAKKKEPAKKHPPLLDI